MTYWLDSDVFIQAKNQAYPFDMMPPFWDFLAEQLNAGKIRASKFVYDELTQKSNDDLAQWCKLRKNKGLCILPNKDVQECYRNEILPWATTNFKPQDALVFGRSADGWVIAQAKVDGGIVVSLEIKDRTKTRIKIPNVCKHFKVKCINTYEMLRELGWKVS